MQLLFWERKNFSPDGAQRKANRLRPLDLWQTYEKILFGRFAKSGYKRFFYWVRLLKGTSDGKAGELPLLLPK